MPELLPATGGIVLADACMLRMLQRVALGQHSTPAGAMLPDLRVREVLTLAAPASVVFTVGLFPATLTGTLVLTVGRPVEQTTAAVKAIGPPSG